jgi:hypothetical protein
MSKIKPLTLEFTSLDQLEKTKAEYNFIGREVSVDRQKMVLTVLTLPTVYKKKSDKEEASRSRSDDSYPDSFRNY